MTNNYSILNGLKTYVFSSKEELIRFVINKKTILIAINAEKIINADNSLRDVINDNIGYSDGFGAVWALKRHGFKNVTRIPGCELWLDIIANQFKDKSIYLIGSKPEVILKTVEKLHKDFPGIRILNYRDGYIKNQKEKTDLISDLKFKDPDIVFVAAGSPTQELLMNDMLNHHPALYMGLGGSFDVYSDYVKRAPTIFRKLNLEWLYRLIKQPSRISRQLHLIKFAYLNMVGRI